MTVPPSDQFKRDVPQGADDFMFSQNVPYCAEDFGPSHRWAVFVCAWTGHPERVGYTEEEFAEDKCSCGAPLVPVLVGPVETDETQVRWVLCPECKGHGQPEGDGSGWDGGGNYHTPACDLCDGRGEVPTDVAASRDKEQS